MSPRDVCVSGVSAGVRRWGPGRALAGPASDRMRGSGRRETQRVSLPDRPPAPLRNPAAPATRLSAPTRRRAAQHDPARGREHAEVLERVGVVDDEVGRRSLVEVASRPSHSRARQEAAPSASCGDIPRSASARPRRRCCRAGALPRRRCRRRAAPRPRGPPRSSRAAARTGRSCGRRSPGTCSPPASAYSGNLSSCIDGRHQRDAVRDHRVDQVRRDSPVPCSMQSMPASIRSGSTAVAEAVRGDPGAVLVGDPDRLGERPPAANDGARSPVSRLIQSPTSLTQPSPRCASWATYAAQLARARPRGRSCGCSAWSGRCAGRPGSAAAGRRGRGSSDVSAAEPASRISSAPASRSSSACCSVHVARYGRRRRRARGGSARRPARARSSPRDRLGAGLLLQVTRPSTTYRSRDLAVGQDRPGDLERRGQPADALAAR